MDRIELTQQDLYALIEWRDAHKDLVRLLPAPLKAVEIIFKHNRYRIKGIRDGNRLTIMLHEERKKLQDVKFEIRLGILVKTGGFTSLTKEAFDDVLTTYCSLMALMVYGKAEVADEAELEIPYEERRSQRPQRTSRKRGKRNTYILRRTSNGIQIAPRGSHASPSGIFTVRGHFRHYKSGKVVWVESYKKGTGKKKSKTYKMGGNTDDRKAVRDVGPAVRAEH